ncbi:MAG: hypothetical protein KAS98_07070 [Deltaproteobacteria bacterium]|nr:hypothetical protein [Deltaproteobacteria bacterium]
MIKQWFLLLILPIMIVSSGCGLIYSNVTRPHSRDFSNTPIGSKKCTFSTHKINVPLMPLATSRISAEWDTECIAEVSRKAGIKKIYYTEIQTLDVLLSTYRRQTIIIYGD